MATIYMHTFSIECSFMLKLNDSLRSDSIGTVVLLSTLKVQKLENSNHWAVLVIVVVVVAVFFFSAQKLNAHIVVAQSTMLCWALLLFISLYKKICYARYFNIPIMFKCFQNLSARHQKKQQRYMIRYTHTHTYTYTCTLHIYLNWLQESALIIYLLCFQRNVNTDHCAHTLLHHLHWSWARYVFGMCHSGIHSLNLPNIFHFQSFLFLIASSVDQQLAWN